MSDVDDIAIDIMNEAMWDHYLEKYQNLLPEWMEDGKKGQWVVLDYNLLEFFDSEAEAHEWYQKQPYGKLMLVKAITDEPSKIFHVK